MLGAVVEGETMWRKTAIFPSLAAAILLSTGAAAVAAADRVVLGEYFTQGT